MNTELQFTSSIFQLAFGLNAVFVVLLNRYLTLRTDLTDEFIRKLNAHNPALDLAGKRKHVTKYLFRTMVGYRAFNTFLFFCIVLALFSSGVSLYFLLKAALDPTEEISSTLVTWLTLGFVVVNPVLYFAFLRASDWFLSAVKTRLVILPELVPLIERSIQAAIHRDAIDETLAQVHIARLRSKARTILERIKSCIHIVRHPALFARSVRRKRIVNKLRREFQQTNGGNQSAGP